MRLNPVSGRDMCKILERIGFQKIHQKGSHARYARHDGCMTVVPVHGNEMLGGPDPRNYHTGRDLKRRVRETSPQDMTRKKRLCMAELCAANDCHAPGLAPVPGSRMGWGADFAGGSSGVPTPPLHMDGNSSLTISLTTLRPLCQRRLCTWAGTAFPDVPKICTSRNRSTGAPRRIRGLARIARCP